MKPNNNLTEIFLKKVGNHKNEEDEKNSPDYEVIMTPVFFFGRGSACSSFNGNRFCLNPEEDIYSNYNTMYTYTSWIVSSYCEVSEKELNIFIPHPVRQLVSNYHFFENAILSIIEIFLHSDYNKFYFYFAKKKKALVEKEYPFSDSERTAVSKFIFDLFSSKASNFNGKLSTEYWVKRAHEKWNDLTRATIIKEDIKEIVKSFMSNDCYDDNKNINNIKIFRLLVKLLAFYLVEHPPASKKENLCYLQSVCEEYLKNISKKYLLPVVCESKSYLNCGIAKNISDLFSSYDFLVEPHLHKLKVASKTTFVLFLKYNHKNNEYSFNCFLLNNHFDEKIFSLISTGSGVIHKNKNELNEKVIALIQKQVITCRTKVLIVPILDDSYYQNHNKSLAFLPGNINEARALAQEYHEKNCCPSYNLRLAAIVEYWYKNNKKEYREFTKGYHQISCYLSDCSNEFLENLIDLMFPMKTQFQNTVITYGICVIKAVLRSGNSGIMFGIHRYYYARPRHRNPLPLTWGIETFIKESIYDNIHINRRRELSLSEETHYDSIKKFANRFNIVTTIYNEESLKKQINKLISSLYDDKLGSFLKKYHAIIFNYIRKEIDVAADKRRAESKNALFRLLNSYFKKIQSDFTLKNSSHKKIIKEDVSHHFLTNKKPMIFDLLFNILQYFSSFYLENKVASTTRNSSLHPPRFFAANRAFLIANEYDSDSIVFDVTDSIKNLPCV